MDGSTACVNRGQSAKIASAFPAKRNAKSQGKRSRIKENGGRSAGLPLRRRNLIVRRRRSALPTDSHSISRPSHARCFTSATYDRRIVAGGKRSNRWRIHWLSLVARPLLVIWSFCVSSKSSFDAMIAPVASRNSSTGSCSALLTRAFVSDGPIARAITALLARALRRR
jgi:hypothetical protein